MTKPRFTRWILCLTTTAFLAACQGDGSRQMRSKRYAKAEETKEDTLTRKEVIRSIIGDSTEMEDAFLQVMQDTTITKDSTARAVQGSCNKTVRLLSDKKKENALVLIEKDCGENGMSMTHYRIFDDEVLAIRHFESTKDTVQGGFNNIEVVLFNDDAWSGMDRESVSDDIVKNLNTLTLRELDSTKVNKLVAELKKALDQEVK